MAGEPMDERKVKFYSGSGPGTLLVLQRAIIAPANAPLLFRPEASTFEFTPLGRFLIEAMISVKAITARNQGRSWNHSELIERSRSSAATYSGITGMPAYQDAKRRNIDDFRIAGDELAKHPELATPEEAIRTVDRFFWVSHAREKPALLDELINDWRRFRILALQDAAAHPFLQYASALNEAAVHGLEKYLIAAERFSSRPEGVKKVLEHHRLVAHECGIEPRTVEIQNILSRYHGILRPTVFPYRRFLEDVPRIRREEFQTGHKGRQETKREFIESLEDPAIRIALYRHGFPLATLKAMREKRSFGQPANFRDPNGVSIEHSAPLTSGDNFFGNFVLSSMGANADNNRLVKLQTDFLPADRLVTVGGATYIEDGYKTDIIILRPKPVLLPDGRSFAGFMRHPDWNWKPTR